MKKRTMNKLALGLAATMLVSSLAGCGNNNVNGESVVVNKEESSSATVSETVNENTVKKEGYPIVDETMTLSVMHAYAEPAVTDPDLIDIHNEIKELTNVEIDWELIYQGSWADKKGLVLARKELPDIIMRPDLSDAEYLNMINAGQLIAIDEYLEYAPNFQKILENSPGLKEAITAEDGHIYAIPNFQGIDDKSGYLVNDITYINQAWLDKLGLKMPTTTEELKDVLVAFKEQDPNGNGIADEVPITVLTSDSMFALFDDWFGSFGIVPSANEIYVRNLTIVDGEVTYAPVRDEYREALDYFHELWDLGVIDPEAFTQDASMFNGKLLSETRVAGMFKCWRGTSWRLSSEDVEYTVLGPLAGPDGDRLYNKRPVGLDKRTGVLVTSDCENPELAVRWIDTLLDPTYNYQLASGQRLGYNIEENADGTYNLLKSVDANDTEHWKRTALGFKCYDTTTNAKTPVNPDPFNVVNEKMAADVYYKDYFPEESYPNVFLTTEEAVRAAELTTDLKSYMESFYSNWIVNGGDDAAWESHLKQLKALGVEEWIEIYAGAYERYKAN